MVHSHPAGTIPLQLCTVIMTNPQKGCQLPGILLQKVCHCGDVAVLKLLLIECLSASAHPVPAWPARAFDGHLCLSRGCCGTCISRCFLFLVFAIGFCQHQMGVCTLWVICFVLLFLVAVLVSVWFF